MDKVIVKGAAQGDILFVRVKEMPDGLKEVEPRNGRLIVAEGEATGHHHSFAFGRAKLFVQTDGAGYMYALLDKPAPIEHQEHGAITLKAGKWKVVRQRVARSGVARRVED